MNAPSKLFFERTHKKSVYNIQPIGNMPSIIAYGILSYERTVAMKHDSIAMAEVQNRRSDVVIPNGGSLHSYANAYFDPRNPMMYRRQNVADTLCLLAISSDILDLDGTIITDGNAASGYSRFYSPEEGIAKLDFDKIYDTWWTDENQFKQMERKRIKCAEVLVPGAIAFEYIVGAIVVSESVQHELTSRGFQKKIVVRPNVFFGKENRS